MMNKVIVAANLNHYRNDQMNRVYSPEGLCPAILTVSGGGRELKVLIREATKKGYAIAEEGDSIDVSYPNSTTRRGRVIRGGSHTIMANENTQCVVYRERVRKLTPKECFRLMGFADRDIDVLIKNGLSKTQLYKMAGNSIVVNVLESLFGKIFESYVL